MPVHLLAAFARFAKYASIFAAFTVACASAGSSWEPASALAASGAAPQQPAAGVPLNSATKKHASGAHVEATTTPIVPPDGLPVLAWVGEDPELTFDGPALATVGDPNVMPSAKVWGAVDANALRLHVEVRDAAHVNTQQGTQIWDGDSVQISIDARGHGDAGLGRDADFVGIGDMYAVFALTQSGAQGWAHLRGAPDAPGALTTPTRIVRDNERGLTIYDIALPWSQLHTLPAAFPTLGLGVQVNDATPGKATQSHIHWGGGVSGTLRPGLLHALAIAPPPPGYADIMLARPDVWSPHDAAEMIVVHHTKDPLRVETTWSETSESLTLRGGGDALRTRLLAVGGPWSSAAQSWHAQMQVSSHNPDGEVLTHSADAQVVAPPLAFQALNEQLDTLLDASRDPLITAHVRNSASIVRQVWEAAATLLPTNAEPARDVLRVAEHILPSLMQDGRDPNTYTHGTRAWLGAFISPDDGTLQPYTVRLPRHWDPNRAHPLIVFLHGKGDPSVTHFVDNAITGSGDPEDDAIVLSPWGRGIYGYRGLPESDVLVALEQVQNKFKVDPDRIYLAGFSMGGAGAWSLALHVPAPWAAVSISSGGTWLTSLGVGMGANAHDIPLQIYHGDADGAVDVSEAQRMRKELEQAGIKADFTIAHGVGHVFNDARWRAMASWLLQHERQPAQSFTYVCDDFIHRGRSGIKMRRDTAVAAFPRATVKITGEKVQITTQGTPGLDVDLGLDGLGLRDNATVIWNGKKVYSGPPTVVTLGIGGGTR